VPSARLVARHVGLTGCCCSGGSVLRGRAAAAGTAWQESRYPPPPPPTQDLCCCWLTPGGLQHTHQLSGVAHDLQQHHRAPKHCKAQLRMCKGTWRAPPQQPDLHPGQLQAPQQQNAQQRSCTAAALSTAATPVGACWPHGPHTISRSRHSHQALTPLARGQALTASPHTTTHALVQQPTGTARRPGRWGSSPRRHSWGAAAAQVRLFVQHGMHQICCKQGSLLGAACLATYPGVYLPCLQNGVAS
jgi:hypothetical protein